jgi:hypothetical protein
VSLKLLTLVVVFSLMLSLFLSRIVTPSFWLELALGAVTPQGFGILIGSGFHLPTPASPLIHMLLLLLLPLHFSNDIINLVIFVALVSRL